MSVIRITSHAYLDISLHDIVEAHCYMEYKVGLVNFRAQTYQETINETIREQTTSRLCM